MSSAVFRVDTFFVWMTRPLVHRQPLKLLAALGRCIHGQMHGSFGFVVSELNGKLAAVAVSVFWELLSHNQRCWW
jgi:hypothetical protein